MSSTIESGVSWKMILGDCMTEMGSVGETDHVITDPPYGERTHANAVTTGSSGAAGVREFAALPSAEKLAETMAGVARRWIVAFCEMEQIGEYARGSGAAWVRGAFWDKVNPMPQLTGDRPGTPGECVAIMHRAGKKKWNRGGGAGIWRHSVEHGNKSHPTQKPVALMLAIVDDFTDPGDTVLDPFAGSGTTGVACLRRGRSFIGIERDEGYFRLACDRLRAEESGSTLQALRSGQLSLLGGAR